MRKQVAQLEFLGSFGEELPVTGLPEVAFAGRSNVGKSSLLNRVLNRKKAARVSGRPGRTQHINLFQVGDSVVLADLPGYGYAKVPDAVQAVWKAFIELYLAEREALQLVVMLVDVRRDPLEMDLELLEGLLESGIPTLVVATKVDKLTKRQRKVQLDKIRRGFSLPEDLPIPFSSVTGEGREDVWDAIESYCGGRNGA